MNERTKEYSNVKEITGDIIEEFKTGKYKLLAHGCNCFHTQKSGVAGSLVKNFPDMILADYKTKRGDINKLGSFYGCPTPYGKILGIYSQYDFGYDGKDRFEYDAFEKALKEINSRFKGFDIYTKKLTNIILPKIGSGLAGGDWNKIKKIIIENLPDLEVTICHLNP